MLHPSPLADKVALITGASGAIGGAISHALGAAGVKLALTGATSTRVRRLHELLEGYGIEDERLLSVPADLTDPEAAGAVVAATKKRYGRLDILVNCAGVGVFKRFPELTLEELQEVVGTNLMATLYTTHHAINALVESKGHVINIISGLSRRGGPNATAYAAAKFGVRGFTESLRIDMARHDVRVTAISPAGAGVDSTFWDRADPLAKREGMLQPERIAEAVLVVLTTRGAALIDDMTVRT